MTNEERVEYVKYRIESAYKTYDADLQMKICQVQAISPQRFP